MTLLQANVFGTEVAISDTIVLQRLLGMILYRNFTRNFGLEIL
jgi:hypothetical protein